MDLTAGGCGVVGKTVISLPPCGNATPPLISQEVTMDIKCSKCGKVIAPAPDFVGARCGISLEGTPPASKEEAEYCKQQFGRFFGMKFTLCWECYFVRIGAADEGVSLVELPWKAEWL